MNDLPQGQSCRRRERRHRVQRGAFAYRVDGSRSVVGLSDMCYEGCRLTGAPEFEPAEKIQLVMPRFGRIAAEVCWSSSGTAGVRFDLSEAAREAIAEAEEPKLGFAPSGISRRPMTFGRKGLEQTQAA